MALHEQSVGKSNEWYTPAYVFEAMEVCFDQDVANNAAIDIPADDWCDLSFTEGGLERKWSGFVWMNPPFGARNGITPWLDKFFAHGNGVALTPDRTSCPWWQDYAPRADLVLFVRKKIKFISGDGQANDSPAQGTTLLAVGPLGVTALQNAARNGLGLLMLPKVGAHEAPSTTPTLSQIGITTLIPQTKGEDRG